MAAAVFWSGLLCILFKLPLFPALLIFPAFVYFKNKKGHPFAAHWAPYPKQYRLFVVMGVILTLRTLIDIYVWIKDGMPIAGVGG